jgi:cell division protein FtsI (penicillin-binding protein 3)
VKPKPQPTFLPWRFYVVITLILLVISGLLARVVDLTIIKRSFLQHEGNARVLRTQSLPAFRGMIVDRNGNPLAVSTSVYSVWVNPREFVDTEHLKALGQLVGLKPQALQKLLQHDKLKHREFVYLRRGVPPAVANQIKDLKLAGLYLREEYKRYYPEGEVAAHVIGLTNVDDQGQEGLELAYNQWLTGAIGKKSVIKDRLGRTVSDVQTLQQQVPGKDITLSIDRRIQYLAYRELLEGLKQTGGSSGSAIVTDVKTGEILAMVNYPSFNPNNRARHPTAVYRNRALTDTFEPGSTIKAFTVATALEAGTVKPDSIIDTHPGWLRVDHRVVRDEHNNGEISVAQILQRSSNVGVTKIALAMKPNLLWELLHRVGFGEVTGIGFPGEQSGALVKRRWAPFTLATLAFGYGLSVTPVQLVQAYSIFANNGNKIPLSLLKLDKTPTSERVLPAAVAQQMMTLLESVTTEKKATGVRASVPGYRVAGKTGTSLLLGTHGYQKHRYTTTFVGIAPASQPALIVAVVVRDPVLGKVREASMVSAPIFERIMESSLRILNIPPDDLASLEKKTVTAKVTPPVPAETEKTLD